MWKDTRESRLRRYQEILKESPWLNRPAEAVREKNPNITEEFSETLRTNQPSYGVDDSDEGTFEDVCDYVLAPALNGFVQWVLKEALNGGKKRLYFLARDGYLMYRAALLYCEKWKLPVECRYLSCSRYSIRIPMFHLNMGEAMDYICRGGIDVTMTKILNRAGLTEGEQELLLAELETGYGKDDMIPYAKLPEIRKALERSPYFMECVKHHSEETMPNLEGYLIQEGLFDGTPSALVDSGWVGSMQKVLNQLTEYIQKKNQMGGEVRLEGYYWGLYELPAGVNPEEYHCYYFSPGENLKEKVCFSNSLFEGIFSAPHGMTLGYIQEYPAIHAPDGAGGLEPSGSAKEHERYKPVYGEIPDEQKEFMEMTERRLMRFTEELLSDSHVGELEDIQHDRRVISRLLGLFMSEPTQAEAKVYGSLHFSDDVLDYGERQLAEPMNQVELNANHLWRKALAMLGVRKKYVKESAWYEGSAVRNGKGVKRHLRGYAGYKYLLYLRKKYQMRNFPG